MNFVWLLCDECWFGWLFSVKGASLGDSTQSLVDCTQSLVDSTQFYIEMGSSKLELGLFNLLSWVSSQGYDNFILARIQCMLFNINFLFKFLIKNIKLYYSMNSIIFLEKIYKFFFVLLKFSPIYYLHFYINI